ncbi:MAG: serine hydrolase [Flavobacteriales bacterium]|nr:MAG: serine hydrolase [Flavobacteriales bacterium]
MKKLNFISLSILFLITLNSCKIGRFVYYNFADINDYKIFPERKVKTGPSTFHFATTDNGKAPKTLFFNNDSVPLGDFLEKNNTVAFLIIKNDTIHYENYWHTYDETSIVPSFSMAKSITSILIGCAIDDHLIKSIKEPVTNYIPELKKNGFEKVTIEHLLQMTSGIDFNESYTNPFGDAATFYYGINLRNATSKIKLKTDPGNYFEYVSGEKTFCCINARARDFAKIGRLYLNKGRWNGKQIVSEDWVRQSTKIDTSGGSAWNYQYQWWLPSKTGDFMAAGILGQYIYVNPEKDLIIVRLGKYRGKTDWEELFKNIGEAF